MTLSQDAISRHLQLCEELHQLALEENRYLKDHQRAPDAALLDRRRVLLERLDASLAELKSADAKSIPADANARAQRKDAVEKSKARLMQILHLQKESEQLVLRYSMGAPRPAPITAPPPPAALQKLYERH